MIIKVLIVIIYLNDYIFMSEHELLLLLMLSTLLIFSDKYVIIMKIIFETSTTV